MVIFSHDANPFSIRRRIVNDTPPRETSDEYIERRHVLVVANAI